MTTDIEFLELLEADLEVAADEEAKLLAAEAEESARLRAAGATGSGAGAAAPGRRGRLTWSTGAAAGISLLVVAGIVGWLAQGGDQERIVATSGTPEAAPADGGGAVEEAAPEPTTAPELGYDAFESDDALEESRQGRSVAGIASTPTQQQDLSKIIRDGRITLVVPDGDFGDSESAVTEIAVTNGGFVLSSTTKEEASGTLTLRIPARHFDRAMNQLRKVGTVKAESITGQDVTAQFVDLHARKKILVARRALILELTREATTIDQTLRLSNEYDQVQLQIEQIQGQLNVINDQVAEATINVDLRERDAAVEEKPDVDNPSLSRAWDLAVSGFLSVLGAVVVGLGYLIPIGIIAGLLFGAWLLLTRGRRRSAES